MIGVTSSHKVVDLASKFPHITLSKRSKLVAFSNIVSKSEKDQVNHMYYQETCKEERLSIFCLNINFQK